MIIFRFFFYFTISFLILSFPISDRPIFDYTYKYARPYTLSVYQFGKETFERFYIQVSRTAKKAYTNSSPVIQEDSLSLGASSLSEIEHGAEEYTPEEKEALKRIMQEQERF